MGITGPIHGTSGDLQDAITSINQVVSTGGLVLLAQVSCSTTTNLLFPGIFSATYKNYVLDITNVEGVSIANNTLIMQFGTANSIAATSIYETREGIDSATAVSITQTVSSGSFPIITNINCSTSGRANGEFRIKNPNRAGLKTVTGEVVLVSSVSLMTDQKFNGVVTDLTAQFTDMKLSWATADNFASGEIRIYGVK